MKILIALVLLLTACTPLPHGSDRTSNGAPIERIIFLTLRMTRNSDKTTSVTLLKRSTAPGTFKQSTEQPHWPNYLTIETYDADRLVSTQWIEHPLYKEVEYQDSTESLLNRSVVLTESDFFFRVQDPGTDGTVKLYETLSGSSKRELATLSLSPQ